MKQTKQTQVKSDQPLIDVDEWKNKYLRALADYQNLVKRTDAEKQEVRKYATEQFLAKLLPVVDTLELAGKHVKNEGLDLAIKELHTVLTQYGVEKIEVAGIPFDPHIMECIEVVEMHNKLLRPSKVQVGGDIKEEVCLK